MEILPKLFEECIPSFDNPTTKVKMPSTHKKDKPWDTDDIDKWKVSF
jgi:hypothetical protein